MSQPGRAPAEGLRLDVTIDLSYGASSGSLQNGGSVYFDVAPPAGCYLYTAPLTGGGQAFRFQTNNYLTLRNGTNGPYYPNGVDVNIYYCACASTSSPCDPLNPSEHGGYTIKVGNPGEDGKEKRK